MELQEKKVNKWSQKADVKHNVFPKDFFATKKSAEGYATGLVKYSGGNVGKAIKRLNFYLNRAGGDVSNKGALKAALKILEKRLEKEKSKKESVEIISADKYLSEAFDSLNDLEEVLNENARLYYKNNKWCVEYKEAGEKKIKEFETRKEGNDFAFELIHRETDEDLEEKKLSPKEIEELEDDDSDDKEKIKRPEGSMRKGEKFGESSGSLDSVATLHQKNIALKTLRMSKEGATVMGGMNHKQAIKFLLSHGYNQRQLELLLKKYSHSDSEIAAMFSDSYSEGFLSNTERWLNESMFEEDISNAYPKFNAKEHQYLLAAFRTVGGSDATSVEDIDGKRWRLEGKEISREGKKIKLTDKTLQSMNGEARSNYWK